MNADITDKTFQKYKLVINVWLSNGRNGTKAYKAIYGKGLSSDSAASNFSKILRITKVWNYVKEREDELLKELGISVLSQVKGLENQKNKADKSSNIKAFISASDQQNKLLGLYEKDNNQKNTGDSLIIYELYKPEDNKEHGSDED